MDALFSTNMSSGLKNATETTDPSAMQELSLADRIEKIFKVSLLCLMALANIAGNSSICFVVLKDRYLRLTVRNFVVASLALTDLLVVQLIIFQVLTYYNIGKEPNLCNLMGRNFGLLLYVSILHLFTLSWDRYIAIFYPLRYRFLVTPKRITVVLLTIWIIPIISIHLLPAVITDLHGFSSFYGCINEGFIEEKDRMNRAHMFINVTFLFFLPLLAMMAAYYRISKIAWYQANRVGVAVVVSTVGVQSSRLPRARERKWAKTLAIVIGAFLGCYLPMVVASLVHIYSGGATNHELAKALEILMFLTFLNTVLNPMIYSLRNYEYRRAFKKICGKCFRDVNNDPRSRANYITHEMESQTVSTLMSTSLHHKDSVS